jgi:hypothetical protein
MGLDQHERLTSFLGFVSRRGDECGPPGVGNGLGELVVTEHVTNFELLKSEALVGVHYIVARLVQKVTPLVRHFPMHSGYLGSLLAAVVRTLASARQPALLPTKLLFALLQRSMRLRNLTSRGGKVVVKTQVESSERS